MVAITPDKIATKRFNTVVFTFYELLKTTMSEVGTEGSNACGFSTATRVELRM
jgi:hypothetical protein